MRLLIVDDKKVDRDSIAERLKHIGWEEEPHCCAGEGEALALMSADPRGFDVVILDQQMEDLKSGLRLMHAMRNGPAGWSNAAVIMLTADANAAEVKEFIHAGAYDWFKKRRYLAGDLLEQCIKRVIAEKQHDRVKQQLVEVMRRPVRIGPESFDATEITVDSTGVFIGAPSEGDFQDIVELVKSSAEQHGLKPVIGNEDPRLGTSLYREIARLLLSCKYAVFDISCSNANVIFEAGLAAGLGREVLIIARSSEPVPANLKGLIRPVYTRTNLTGTLKPDLDKFFHQGTGQV